MKAGDMVEQQWRVCLKFWWMNDFGSVLYMRVVGSTVCRDCGGVQLKEMVKWLSCVYVEKLKCVVMFCSCSGKGTVVIRFWMMG
jgi:hypothetical protein